WSQTSNREFTVQEVTDCTTTSEWDGTSWSNGIPDSTTNAIINGDFVLSADAEWCGLDILNGSFSINQGVKLTLNDTNTTLRIESSGELNVEGIIGCAGDIENNSIITFNSSTTETGQFDVFTGSISGTGDVTVERYIPAKRAFRFLSSAVTTTDFILENWQQNGLNPGDSNYLPNIGTHITGGNASLGFDQSGSNNPSMFTFDNTFVPTGAQTQGNAWTALTNTNSTRLNVGEGYLTMVRGDRSIDLTTNSAVPTVTTLVATGDLFTGPSSPILSNELGLYSLVANPYQAVVDYSLVTRTDLTDFIYIWDASIGGNNGRGGYVTVDISSNSVTNPNPTTSDASKFIAPGMSFFVQNLSSGTISPSLTFNENDKATGENQVTVFSTIPNFYINSRLYLSSDLQNGNSERDAVGLRFSNNFTTLASDEDATKIGNPDENFAIENNGLRSIDKRALPSSGEEIQFVISNYTSSTYSLLFIMGNQPQDLEVILKDNYLSTQTVLTDTFVYNFTVDQNLPESYAGNRFSLLFDQTALSDDDFNLKHSMLIYPNPTSDGSFSIDLPSLNGNVQVRMTNLLGQKIYDQNQNIESNQVKVKPKKLSSGVYLVEIIHDNHSFTTKLIVD
ncbi:MAG: T9SS type A sorting domain-containing protein, partial [Bacteroidetes bacterium]|nr:T9SS type A sorting domain-containing protein [Bacteroidota bacterium]